MTPNHRSNNFAKISRIGIDAISRLVYSDSNDINLILRYTLRGLSSLFRGSSPIYIGKEDIPITDMALQMALSCYRGCYTLASAFIRAMHDVLLRCSRVLETFTSQQGLHMHSHASPLSNRSLIRFLIGCYVSADGFLIPVILGTRRISMDNSDLVTSKILQSPGTIARPISSQ